MESPLNILFIYLFVTNLGLWVRIRLWKIIFESGHISCVLNIRFLRLNYNNEWARQSFIS